MSKGKFWVFTAITAVISVVSYVLNIPEMVEGQGHISVIVFSALFLIITAAYAFVCKDRKVARIIGTVYWSLSLLEAVVIAAAVLSGSDSSVFIIPAFAVTGGYYSLAALLGPPSIGYLIALAVFPAAQLVLRIVLAVKAKKSQAVSE